MLLTGAIHPYCAAFLSHSEILTEVKMFVDSVRWTTPALALCRQGAKRELLSTSSGQKRLWQPLGR